MCEIGIDTIEKASLVMRKAIPYKTPLLAIGIKNELGIHIIKPEMLDLSLDLKLYLTDENNKLKNELRRIKANIEAAEETAGGSQVSNIDLLRRLSQLEKVVYGKDE